MNFEIANEALENLEKTNKNSHEVDIASYFLFLNQIDDIDIDKENEIMERLNMEHHRRSFGKDGLGHEYYYKFPVSNGILTEHDGLTVDN